MSEPAKSPGPGQRTAARRHWPIRRATLDDQDDPGHMERLTPAERIGMMWRLALDSWLLSGRTIPDYDRANIPGRVVRPDDDGKQDAGGG